MFYFSSRLSALLLDIVNKAHIEPGNPPLALVFRQENWLELAGIGSLLVSIGSELARVDYQLASIGPA